jgi:hypothetical protein
MSGIETHNFSGSRHDHSVPTLRQGHWKSRCFINVLMRVIGSFCCISAPRRKIEYRQYIDKMKNTKYHSQNSSKSSRTIHLAMQCLLLSVSSQEREGSCIFVLEVLMLSLSVRLDFGLFWLWYFVFFILSMYCLHSIFRRGFLVNIWISEGPV